MALLLTGERGYLGSAVAARLDALGIEWQPLQTRLEGIAPSSLANTRVIHCAGALRHRPRDWQRSNVEGMARLLTGLRAPARIVYASSRSVYGGPLPMVPGFEPTPWKETDATHPADGYGQSKLAAERLLRESVHAGTCVRLSTLFGQSPRGDCPSLPNAARKCFERGETVHLLAHDIRVDYLAVADAARALVELALRDEVVDPVINLAGPARGLHGLLKAIATDIEGEGRIEYDHPPGPVWPCLDTGLLSRCMPGFEATPDELVARDWPSRLA